MSDNTTAIHFTNEELLALSEFFGKEGGLMEDEPYDRLSRRFLIAAARRGLLDHEL